MRKDIEFEKWARDLNNQQAEDWQIWRAARIVQRDVDAEICKDAALYEADNNALCCEQNIREQEIP